MNFKDIFYELADNLCRKYLALTPFMVRREKFGEVINLVQWINNSNLKTSSSKERTWKDSRGNTHIRREAKNDDWY